MKEVCPERTGTMERRTIQTKMMEEKEQWDDPYHVSGASIGMIPPPLPVVRGRISATLVRRLIGNGIDVAILMGSLMVADWVMSLLQMLIEPAPEWRAIVWLVGSRILGFSVFLAVQARFLHRSGQTIGKRVAKTKIVELNLEKPPLGVLLGRRYGLVMLISCVPLIGPYFLLADLMFVFGTERRCLHDYIAGTRVIDCAPSSDGARPLKEAGSR